MAHYSPDIVKPGYRCWQSKKDTLQAIHNPFVNTAYIYYMMDNRVLNNQPPPINSKETTYRGDNGPLLQASEFLQKATDTN